MDVARPRVGISACLLGTSVRFDGGHKRDIFVHDTLGQFVDFVPVCPEVESGMSIPREPLRQVSERGGIRLVGTRTGKDQSGRLESYARRRVDELADLDLDGFILKKDSPSCGLERVRVHAPENNRPPSRDGVGFFARRLKERLPSVPLTEEGWLRDALRRETFLHQIFTHHRLRTDLLAQPSAAGLVSFHSDHKLLYMAHSPEQYRELGRLVAHASERPLKTTLEMYESRAMAALAPPATPGKQANVLQHILGYFRSSLTTFEKHELLSLIEDFQAGCLCLLVPLTLLRHHLHTHGAAPWLMRQHYFHPYPKALNVC